MAKSENEIRQQMEEFCERVLKGAKLNLLERQAMENLAALKGKYDQGYRVGLAQQSLRTYTLTYNPATERVEVEYH